MTENIFTAIHAMMTGLAHMRIKSRLNPSLEVAFFYRPDAGHTHYPARTGVTAFRLSSLRTTQCTSQYQYWCQRPAAAGIALGSNGEKCTNVIEIPNPL